LTNDTENFDGNGLSGEESNNQEFETRFFNPRNDVAFKKVFVQHEDLTRSFLNSTLRLRGSRQIQSVEFLPTERLPITSESKKSILDVLCTDQRGFQYIIEVQNKFMQHYIQRIQHYVSHLYSGQLERANDYLALKPVTLLSLLNHTIFPKEVGYLSFHHNFEKETQVSYLNDMSYVFIELPKFTKKEEDLKTGEDYWIFMMKNATQMHDVPQGAPEEVKQAYGILERHKWTREERLAYEQAKIALMDEIDAMRTSKEEGRAEREKEMVKIMISEGSSLEFIQKVSGLDMKAIEQIKEGANG